MEIWGDEGRSRGDIGRSERERLAIGAQRDGVGGRHPTWLGLGLGLVAHPNPNPNPDPDPHPNPNPNPHPHPNPNPHQAGPAEPAVFYQKMKVRRNYYSCPYLCPCPALTPNPYLYPYPNPYPYPGRLLPLPRRVLDGRSQDGARRPGRDSLH